jgi:acetolactate synthase-1/2/3 large subunit
MSGAWNGARALAHTLVNCGIDTCFVNPGTTELHLIAALGELDAMREVLCLFEGVATGAADGYGRVAGKPAATLLHLGPGLANGLANLHNARRAATPLVNLVGDHAAPHREHDALLVCNIEGFARPVSSWLGRATSAATLAADAARAVQAARAPPGSVSTLIVPADAAWDAAEGAADALPDLQPTPVGADRIDEAARGLRRGAKAALLLRGPALCDAGLEAAGRIQAATGARLLCDTFAPRAELGAGRVPVERIPYFADHALAFLREIELLVLVGSTPPVSTYAHPGGRDCCAPDGGELVRLAAPHEDALQALAELAEALHAPGSPAARHPFVLPDLPSGALTATKVAQVIAHLTPEHAIYAEEAMTCGLPLLVHLARARPHTHLPLAGGAVGQGLPLAAGAAIAAPHRKIVCPHGDGGAAYTLQALWTMAREGLDVTTIIYANRSYAILNVELQRIGLGTPGAQALAMFDLANPALDWVQLANGLGVEASRVETAEELAAHYASAMASPGPRLIEALIPAPAAPARAANPRPSFEAWRRLPAAG